MLLQSYLQNGTKNYQKRKDGKIENHHYDEYSTAALDEFLLDDVYALYRKLGLKHKPASPAKLYEYNHPKYIN